MPHTYSPDYYREKIKERRANESPEQREKRLAKRREHYRKNKEAILRQKGEYYRENKEAILQRNKMLLLDPEKKRAKQDRDTARRRENKEHVRALARARYAKDRAQNKPRQDWYAKTKADPERYAAYLERQRKKRDQARQDRDIRAKQAEAKVAQDLKEELKNLRRQQER